jgi:hypothetical protein
MGDLKKTTQMPGGAPTGMTPEGDEGERNRGSELGAREPGTAGTDSDLDRGGTSINQGHGHPREERGASHD